jgi:ABC-type amino acid transport substrate-binding protein
MLYAKRIDFFIEDELVCEEAIKRIFPGEEEKFATLEANAKEQDYYMITSPDYPSTEELLQRFNSAIK